MWQDCTYLKGGSCEFYFESVLQVVIKNHKDLMLACNLSDSQTMCILKTSCIVPL